MPRAEPARASRACGEAGASVQCTGPSSREEPLDAKRPEAIEETAELVSAAVGKGIVVRVDHTDDAAVERVRAEHGKLDILVNDIWGGDPLTEWSKRFWEVDVPNSFGMLERAIQTRIITSRHGLLLMLDGQDGMVVEITDGAFCGYRGQLFYDPCKLSVIRLAYAAFVKLALKSITSVALTSGFLRSEDVLEHFGVTEANWGEAIPQDRHFALSETPLLVGRTLTTLAYHPSDMRVLSRSSPAGIWPPTTASRTWTARNPTGTNTGMPPSRRRSRATRQVPLTFCSWVCASIRLTSTLRAECSERASRQSLGSP